MKTIVKIFLLVIISFAANGQELSFSSEVSTDNIDIDEVFELKYSISGGSGEFTPPILEFFEIVGGPNVQSSIQIMNGEVRREKSYIYFIRPKVEGELSIEYASLNTDDGILTTSEILIYVGTERSKIKNNHKQTPIKRKRSRSIFSKEAIKKI